jgi:transposase
MKETLTLNQKEQKRVMVLNQIETRKLRIEKGATLLGLSERQMWRIVAGYRKEGVEALVHGNRGRKPVNAIEDSIRLKVIELSKCPYAGFNHQHLTEKLNEKEGIHLCRSTIRQILLAAGLSSPRKRRPPKHRSRRERYPKEGMLLQTDGSPHDWLEGRGPKLCLIGAIDDATNTVPAAFFQEQEDSQGYMRLLREILAKKGIPLALYHDQHSIFDLAEDKLPTLEEQLKGKKPLTQMGRLLEELGIGSISANSPQAKGRIERLWGTFQDRLVSEMRLAGAKTKEEANQVLKAWLPDYNRKLTIPARETEVAYRKVGKGFKAAEYFCFKHTRTVDLIMWSALDSLGSRSATPDRLSYAAVR